MHKGVLFRDALKAHQKYRNQTPLKRNLGDGFLYFNNPVFRSVRDAALDSGVRFDTRDFCDYQQAPLLALGRILRARRIPYFDNVSSIVRLEKKRPRAFGAADFAVRPNYLLHESAHCIADAVFTKRACAGLGLTEDRDIVLRSLLGECLANTADAFAAAAADTPLHCQFHNWNSYWVCNPTERAILTDLAAELGWSQATILIYLSFLMVNFFYESLKTADIRRLAHLALADWPRSPQARRRIQAGARVTLFLDPAFRMKTIPFFLKYEFGIRTRIFKLMNFDLLDFLEASPGLLTQIRQAVAVLRPA
ncbi:MAG: hypothetical protein HY074_15715 [Deltaproteobacteria bacterium]|nr:hypothetical protein [Deltaproteobacteria bacterium]